MSLAKKVYLSPPHVSEEERIRVQSVFDSNWIAPLGPEVDSFERDVATYCNVSHAAALSSGTAAIHLALQILGVRPGDQVIVQSFTFVATANPILYLGAEPIFVDSEPETWNINPSHLEEAIQRCIARGRLPKAVIAVDLYGAPAQYDLIGPICEKFEIPLLEDAAEALGSYYHGKPAGSFGQVSTLSFNGNKIITTSGGGALLSNDPAIVAKARFLSTQSRDPAPHYQHSEIGYNYRMSNVLAAIGRAQLAGLESKVTSRRANFDRYASALAPKGVIFPKELPNTRYNRWLTTPLFPPKLFGSDFPERLRLKLEKLNIESRPLWKPLHLQPLFKNTQYFGSHCAESLFNSGLCLPSGSSLLAEDQNRVISECLSLISTG